MTARASEAFEQRIHQIHELVETFDAEVTWNERIPDPDNPSRKRQIDITVRRGQHLTLIECRLHKGRQDVKWIEELTGRRQSLGADAIIAVSSSGFTAGALEKAKRYDVITRHLRELTDEEVLSWGRSVALKLFFYEYSNMDLTVVLHSDSVSRLDPRKISPELAKHPVLASVFNQVARVVEPELRPIDEHISRSVNFRIRLVPEGVRLGGEPVLEIACKGAVRLVAQDIVSPVVQAYGRPGEEVKNPSATVQSFPIGDTSIVHDGERVSVFLDISKINMPPLRQFRCVKVVGEHVLDYEVFSFLGIEKLCVRNGPVNVLLVAYEDHDT